jgi:L-amino acid N-acyltransferase
MTESGGNAGKIAPRCQSGPAGNSSAYLFFYPCPQYTDNRGHSITRLFRNFSESMSMPGEMKIREMQESDCDAVMRIFNHYVTTGFAAYPDSPLPPQFFSVMREGSLSSVVLDNDGDIIGFGLLKPFLPFPAFRKTGMLTYFIAPEATGKGFGTRLLERFLKDAQKRGLTTMVATMSSRNEASIRFHKRRGFREAGNLSGVGEKFGEPFDVLWMQRAVE